MRAAIYTRKSAEKGLEQDFNSLDRQQEACAAYIASQGWVELPARYADGGFSGGTIERPAFQRLLREVDAGGVDVIVVHRLDRLSRSLADFVKLMRRFRDRGVALVSVTQSFDTSSATGALLLNILVSFAEFERQMASERTRDKMLATRRRGHHGGGRAPIGYRLDAKRLVVDPAGADIVRTLFAQLGDGVGLTETARFLNAQGWRTARSTS